MTVNRPDRFKRLGDVPEARTLALSVLARLPDLARVLRDPGSYTCDIQDVADSLDEDLERLADLLFDPDWAKGRTINFPPGWKPPGDDELS